MAIKLPIIPKGSEGYASLEDFTSLNSVVTNINNDVHSLKAGGVWRASYPTYADLVEAYPNLDVTSTEWNHNDFVEVQQDESSEPGHTTGSPSSYIVIGDKGDNGEDIQILTYRRDDPVPIGIANNTDLGVVRGSTMGGSVSINADGTMTVNGGGGTGGIQWFNVLSGSYDSPQTVTFVKPIPKEASEIMLLMLFYDESVPSTFIISQVYPNNYLPRYNSVGIPYDDTTSPYGIEITFPNADILESMSIKRVKNLKIDSVWYNIGGEGSPDGDGSNDLSDYLPLSGGTMTGTIKLPTSGTAIKSDSGYDVILTRADNLRIGNSTDTYGVESVDLQAQNSIVTSVGGVRQIQLRKDDIVYSVPIEMGVNAVTATGTNLTLNSTNSVYVSSGAVDNIILRVASNTVEADKHIRIADDPSVTNGVNKIDLYPTDLGRYGIGRSSGNLSLYSMGNLTFVNKITDTNVLQYDSSYIGSNTTGDSGDLVVYDDHGNDPVYVRERIKAIETNIENINSGDFEFQIVDTYFMHDAAGLSPTMSISLKGDTTAKYDLYLSPLEYKPGDEATQDRYVKANTSLYMAGVIQNLINNGASQDIIDSLLEGYGMTSIDELLAMLDTTSYTLHLNNDLLTNGFYLEAFPAGFDFSIDQSRWSSMLVYRQSFLPGSITDWLARDANGDYPDGYNYIVTKNTFEALKNSNYTVAQAGPNQASFYLFLDDLNFFDGRQLLIKAATTNDGTTPVNAKVNNTYTIPVYKNKSMGNLPAGTIIEGFTYYVTYNADMNAFLLVNGHDGDITYTTEDTFYTTDITIPHVQAPTGDIPLAPMSELVLHVSNDQGYWNYLQMAMNQITANQALATKSQQQINDLLERVAVLENTPMPDPEPVYDMTSALTLHTPALLGLLGLEIGSVDLIGSGWTAPGDGLIVIDGASTIGLLTPTWIAVNGVKADPSGTVVLTLLGSDGSSGEIKVAAGDVITQSGMGNITYYKRIS